MLIPNYNYSKMQEDHCIKKVLITGAAGVVGRALCNRLTDFELLLHDYKGRAALGGDMTSAESVEELGDKLEVYKPLYALIHTVGDYFEAPLVETEAAEWQRLFQSNVISCLQLVRRLKPKMLITFGVAGLELPAQKMGAYLAVKNALMSLTKSLAAQGVFAAMICPGVITGSRHVVNGPEVSPEVVAEKVHEILLGGTLSGEIIDLGKGVRSHS